MFDSESTVVHSEMDSEMKSATIEGAAEHKRYLDGEITLAEYYARRAEILRKHGLEPAA